MKKPNQLLNPTFTQEEIALHLSALKRILRKVEGGQILPLEMTEAPRIFHIQDIVDPSKEGTEARPAVELRVWPWPLCTDFVLFQVWRRVGNVPKEYKGFLPLEKAMVIMPPVIIDACHDWIDHLEVMRQNKAGTATGTPEKSKAETRWSIIMEQANITRPNCCKIVLAMVKLGALSRETAKPEKDIVKTAGMKEGSKLRSPFSAGAGGGVDYNTFFSKHIENDGTRQGLYFLK